MWRILIVSILFPPLMGCGKHNQGLVSGTITYHGQPVNGVTLHLYPIPGPGTSVSIPVTQEGTFRTTNVPAGEYKVVVEAPKVRAMPGMPKKVGDPAKQAEMEQKFKQAYKQQTPTIAYPDKYKTLDNTDLKCTINESNPSLTLELKD